MSKHQVRSLIVLPDDSAKPLLEAIATAKKSVRVKIFALSAPPIVDALIAAHRRGVTTRVMVDPTRQSRNHDRTVARQRVEHAGIDVRDSNPEFSATHEKSLVIDEATAFVQSCNWETENFTETRDYAVRTQDPEEVHEIVTAFEADWGRKAFIPHEGSRLLWAPVNARQRIAMVIDQANETLVVQNERIQDAIIVERLVRARVRGVKVHVLARPVHSLSEDNLTVGIGDLQIMRDTGIRIHTLRHLKLHGKMILADDERAIIGSINLSEGSFDKRRELAIEVTDEAIVDRLRKVTHEDWKHSKPLDLSDEGLATDLERHHVGDYVVVPHRQPSGKATKPTTRSDD
jgi:cardiolipin synthase A/B